MKQLWLSVIALLAIFFAAHARAHHAASEVLPVSGVNYHVVAH